MNEINELRKQVHKFGDIASEKELEVVYHILEANETQIGGMKFLLHSKGQLTRVLIN